jgi:hypothetical protein
MKEIFKSFDNSDTFYIVIEAPGHISLELGTELLRPSQDLFEDDLEDWAEANYEEELYKDEKGNIDYEWIRDTYDEEHEGGSSNFATPNGRAFEYFEDFDFPEDVKIAVVDGDGPGSDWAGVMCESIADIVKLQQHLEAKGSLVNFIIKP